MKNIKKNNKKANILQRTT